MVFSSIKSLLFFSLVRRTNQKAMFFPLANQIFCFHVWKGREIFSYVDEGLNNWWEYFRVSDIQISQWNRLFWFSRGREVFSWSLCAWFDKSEGWLNIHPLSSRFLQIWPGYWSVFLGALNHISAKLTVLAKNIRLYALIVSHNQNDPSIT